MGAGHNGLVAAAYLARAGLSVLVLERLDRVGGATVSSQPFAGRQVRMSRYADLVSLMPEQLMADLELDVQLVSRPTASYAPVVRDGRHRGLLVERPEGKRTRLSFLELTDSSREYDMWCSFCSRWPPWRGRSSRPCCGRCHWRRRSRRRSTRPPGVTS